MNNQRRNDFRNDIRKTFVVYALIPIVIITFVSYLAVFFIWNNAIIYRTKENIDHISYELEQTISLVIDKTDEIAVSGDFYKSLDNIEQKTNVYQELYSFTNKIKEKVDFYIFDSSTDMLVGSRQNIPSFVTKDNNISWGIIKRMKQNPYDVVFECNKVYKDNIKVTELIIGRAIINQEVIKGYIVFVLYGEEFIKSIGNSVSQIVVTDRYDNIFLATTSVYSNFLDKLKPDFRNTIGYAKVEKNKYYILRKHILQNRLAIYAINPLGSLLSVFTWVGLFFILVFAMLILAIFIIAKKIAFEKTRIIDRIVDAFKEVQQGNLDVILDIKSYDEFEIIGESYNMMLASIKNLIITNEERVRQTIMSEIKQLESQFNPHFLFNTLEHIKYMAKMDPGAASKMIVNLSTLLRYSISSNISDVTINEDLEYTKNYLQIQKNRFSNRFTYTMSVEEGTENCIVPKLIIQPIIENAIKYGFESRDTLEIRIKVCFVEERLIIVIFDDGIGMEEEHLNHIKAILNGTTNNSSHIGLYNVHRRVKLMYGEDYGIDIRSEKFEGTVVRIILPINKRGECYAESIGR
ncbi:sensor histidine kinase [Cellulosilyticum sp. I15G10I2]|uniref:sensor histidine kinase n=1 Tax=Cellulosilyticum sp. I15G10I2 TaxID=1892843 RepID=UPI00085CC483|nr:sensor histidine kinase [Cellulosilyticum sp. I15G10I2]